MIIFYEDRINVANKINFSFHENVFMVIHIINDFEKKYTYKVRAIRMLKILNQKYKKWLVSVQYLIQIIFRVV